jgi:hypothetical protein
MLGDNIRRTWVMQLYSSLFRRAISLRHCVVRDIVIRAYIRLVMTPICCT